MFIWDVNYTMGYWTAFTQKPDGSTECAGYFDSPEELAEGIKSWEEKWADD